MNNIYIGSSNTIHHCDKYKKACCGARAGRGGVVSVARETTAPVTCKKCLSVMANREVPATSAIADLSTALQQIETDATATLEVLGELDRNLDNAPKFAVGDYVQVAGDWFAHNSIQQVVSVNTFFHAGTHYRLSGGNCGLFHESILFDASLEYNQPALPAPKFALGDWVTITAEYEPACGQQRRIDEIKWSYGRYFYYTGRMKNVSTSGFTMRQPECFFGYELKIVPPVFTIGEPVIIDDRCISAETQPNTVYTIDRVEWQFNEWVYWLEGVVKTFWFDYELKSVIDHYRDENNWLEREASVQ